MQDIQEIQQLPLDLLIVVQTYLRRRMEKIQNAIYIREVHTGDCITMGIQTPGGWEYTVGYTREQKGGKPKVHVPNDTNVYFVLQYMVEMLNSEEETTRAPCH